MMNIDKFREIIKQRIHAEEISHGEWDEEFDRCRQEELQIIVEDIPSAIEFLKNECTADEYSWISEILEDIIEETSSREFLDCYKSLMTKFPEECEKYNIAGMIQIAEDMLEWGETHGQEN